jgi:hypothetical protein
MFEVPQANAAVYTMTGTQELSAGTKDIADSGLPAIGSSISIIVPLIIFGIIVGMIKKKI